MAKRDDKPNAFSERLFRCLLRLFPGEFRERFAGEMETVLRDQRQDARAAGRAAHARFWFETYWGLITTAFREHQQILFQDVDYGLRMMRKELGFTVVVVLILGLAIGASTAAFTAANAILIQPLPFSGGNHLIHLQQRQPAVGLNSLPFSVTEIEDYRRQNHTLESLVEFHSMTFSLLGGHEPERVDTGVVSANFFRVLGVSALHGRTFLDEDDRPDATPVLILSYNFWMRSFGGDPSVVGQKYSMNDKQHMVIGVLPPIPQFPQEVDVYMPTSACPTRSGEHALHQRNWHMMDVYATLKPGVTLAAAQQDVSSIARNLQRKYPEDYPASRGYDVELAPVHEELTRDIRPVLTVLAAATGLLLLLACSNVAGINLSRMLARTRELMVRTILGASRARIVRSFVTEGILLAVFGGALGFALAFWSFTVLVHFTAQFTTLSSQLKMAAQEVAFCVLLSIVAGTVVGLLPALAVRHTTIFAEQSWGTASLPRRVGMRVRGILIAVQLALSVVLMVGAGLTLRTLLRLEHTNAGFDPTGVFTARIYVLNSNHPDFYSKLLERARTLPAVQSAALASSFPLYARDSEGSSLVQVRDSQVSSGSPISGHIVTPDYFQTIGIRLVAGRGFTENDNGQAAPVDVNNQQIAAHYWPHQSAPEKPAPVVIINQHMATHYWPNQNAVGKQISVSPGEWISIIGVVSDVRQQGLDKDPVDEVYGSLAEAPRSSLSILVRTTQTSPELPQQLAWLVHDLDPDAVITDVQPMIQVRVNWLASRRTTALFLSIFAMIALCITASGISGMMALSVGERKHEIGVRLAVGATTTRVIGSMMRQAIALIALGLGGGLVIAWALSKSMSGVLYGVGPRDSLTFALSSMVLLAVAVASSFVPLTRVAKLDPVVLLRAE